MQNWNEGYTADINYTFGYYSNLAPARMNFSCLLAQQTPVAVDAGCTYLELGVGQGLSLAIHGAANPGEYWGNDFNPAQAATADDLARASGAKIHACEDSFEELLARPDLPDFDFITMHGIWSWVGEENRNTLIELIRRKLKPGGLLYVSYNVLPGWSGAISLRGLMKETANLYSSQPVNVQIEKINSLVERLIGNDAAYFVNNPFAGKKFDSFKDKPANYIAHEFLNANWDPMPFAETAALLSKAKLNYVGSSNTLEHVPVLNLTEAAQTHLAEIESLTYREMLRDFYTNQAFRRDIYVKGARPIKPAYRNELLQKLKFAALKTPEERPLVAEGTLIKADLPANIYEPIMNCLAENSYKAKSIPEIAQNKDCQHLTGSQIFEALTVLCGTEACAPVGTENPTKEVLAHSTAFNNNILQRAESSVDISFLASPVLGAGLGVGRVDQLFLRAAQLKIEDPVGWIWGLLSAQGQKIIKDGKTLESDEENLQEIRDGQAKFLEHRLPILKSLRIV